jgi:ribonuclease HI
LRINCSARGDLRKWSEWIKKNIPKQIIKPQPPQALITTDAAPTGWGATLYIPSLHNQTKPKEDLVAFGTWNKFMSNQYSNRRELVAIHMALRAFSRRLTQENCLSILVLSDNTTAVYNINRMAAGENLYRPLKRLLHYVADLRIAMKAAHIPGVLNDVPDALSRLETSGDYQIKAGVLWRCLQ